MSDVAALGFPVGIWRLRAHTIQCCPPTPAQTVDYAGATIFLDEIGKLVPNRFTVYPQETLPVVSCVAIGHHI